MRKRAILFAGLFIFSFLAFAAATPMSPLNVPRLSFSNTAYGSLNWAGYAETSGTYSSVSSSWQVPTVSNTTSGYSSAWIGIGGFSGNSVIQIGTSQDCLSGSTTAGERAYHGFIQLQALPSAIVIDNKPSNPGNSGNSGGKKGSSSSCTPNYYAWWELYPQNAEQQISNFAVNPGDDITSSIINNNDGSWTLTIKDINTGKTFSTIQTPNFSPDLGSAEAIIERPALCNPHSCKLTSLADFGAINFTGTTAGTLFDSSADSITMVENNGAPLATPGPMNNGDFTVIRN